MTTIDTTTTTKTRTGRTGRKPAPRVEALLLADPAPELSHADHAIAIATSEPANAPAAPATPAPAAEDERLAKLRAKAQKAAERAARAEARLNAAEKGEPVPSFGGGKKGDLPAVHDLNRLARHARCMHRAAEWTWDGPDHAGKAEAVLYLKAARDAAIAEWTAGVEKRRAAGAGDAKALHELGLHFPTTTVERLLRRARNIAAGKAPRAAKPKAKKADCRRTRPAPGS